MKRVGIVAVVLLGALPSAASARTLPLHTAERAAQRFATAQVPDFGASGATITGCVRRTPLRVHCRVTYENIADGYGHWNLYALIYVRLTKTDRIVATDPTWWTPKSSSGPARGSASDVA